MSWLHAWVLSASADTLEVGEGAPFPTIQAAVDEADDGDRIEVHPGRYPAAVHVYEKALEIVSTEGSAETTLEAVQYNGYYQPIFRIEGPKPVTLTGFSIDGLGEAPGLLIYFGDVVASDLRLTGSFDRSLVVDSSTFTMTDSVFVASPDAYGAHAQVYESDATFERVAFTKGHAGYGGGAAYVVRSNATFRSCTFSDNDASDGGALLIEGDATASTTFEDCLFERNEALFEDGGAVSQYGGTLSFLRTTLRENVARQGGGAITHGYGTSFRFEDGRIERNTSQWAGGIALYDTAETDIVRSAFVDNQSPDDAGGVLLYGIPAEAEIAGNRFCGNGTDGNGGAVMFETYGTLVADVHHNVFVGNRAGWGGAVSVWSSVADIYQNTIVDTVTAEDRGAVWVGDYATATVTGNAFTHSRGAGTRKEPGAIEVDLGYTLYFRNDQDQVGIATSPSTVEGDPKYVDRIEGSCDSDLHPGPGSALIDAGDPELLDDDGSRSDIGAYGGPGAPEWMDVDGDGVLDGDCRPFDPTAGVVSDEIPGDGLDNDCDGTELCWVDGDGDGIGGDDTATAGIGCDDPGFSDIGGDCDDQDPEETGVCGGAGPETPDQVTPGEDLPPRWFCSVAGGSPSWAALGALAVWLWARRRLPLAAALAGCSGGADPTDPSGADTSPSDPSEPEDTASTGTTPTETSTTTSEDTGTPSVPCTPLVSAVLFDLGETLVHEVDEVFYPREGAAETVAALKDAGLPIGIVTNTYPWWDEGDLRDALAEPSLLDAFDVVLLSSEAESPPKPAPEIFAEAWSLLPGAPPIEQTAFVTEELGDLQGAQAAGMYGVWLTDRESPLPDATSPYDDLGALVDAPWLTCR